MPQAVLSIRGKQSEWGLTVPMKQGQIDAMRADGIEIGILANTVPFWIAECGLTRPWCFVQDIWNFKNPWRR